MTKSIASEIFALIIPIVRERDRALSTDVIRGSISASPHPAWPDAASFPSHCVLCHVDHNTALPTSPKPLKNSLANGAVLC